MCGYSPGFLGEGRQTTVGLSNTVIFIVFTSYLFGNYYTGYTAPRRLFSDPKCMALNDPE